MPQSEDENMYGDQEEEEEEEEEEMSQISDDEEDIGHDRRGKRSNHARIQESEDDEDDDDEEEDEEDDEEAKKELEGFIVQDEEESDTSDKATVRRKKRKKVEDYDDDLDEEDLDLLEENTGIKMNRSTGPKLKRLKRGREEVTSSSQPTRGGVDNIFSDDDDELNQAPPQPRQHYTATETEDYEDASVGARYRRDTYDDMGDFIADEDDDEEDDDLKHVIGGETSQPRYNYGDQRRGGTAKGKRANRDMMDVLPAGISEEVLVDMYDIFGDGGDYEYALYDDEETEANREREPQLTDIFEPSELAERMMTDKDEEIRLRDVPERLQMRYEGIKSTFEAATTEQVKAEGDWIARVMIRTRAETIEEESLPPSPEFITAVTHVVGFFTQDFLEVPYIKDHRRDFFTQVNPSSGISSELLTEKDLWEIYDLDFKYQSLIERRQALNDFLIKCHINDDYVNQMLEHADKVEEVTDLTEYINLKFASQINVMQQQTRGTRRPMNKSLYDASQETKVHQFLPKIAITARQFGSNYTEKMTLHLHEDSDMDPDLEAEHYLDATFDTVDKVLKASKSILAQEIAFDPQVRKAIRREWELYATVTVRPTEKGYVTIDQLHPMRPFKFLNQKPVRAFNDGQFLHILKGEADNLLNVSIGIKEYKAWFDSIANYYITDGYSDTIMQWNDQRKEIIDQSLKEYLMPLMTKYVREKLRMEAQEAICRASFDNLYTKINVGPFRGPESQFKSPLPRVITVSSGAGTSKDPIVAIFVNQRGKVLDQLEVANLKDERYWNEMADFIKSKKANVLGVAGYNADTRRVIKHMQTMLTQVNEHNGTAARMDMVVVDDEASRLYKASRRAQEEFPQHTETMRYCISLARRLQNPVLEYVGLGRDLLALHHHDLQYLVPEDTLISYLERALISVVNDLGFDINAAIQSPSLALALQYVCGFGPRKSSSILKKIEASGELESRSALVLRKLTGTNTFMNCASYLRIRDIEGADILDDTRIHPQDYELARKMAADALEIDEDEMDDYDSKVAVVTRVIKEYPDKLNDLILDDYAHVLQKKYAEPKRQVLEHIKMELQGPYHDRRQRYPRPNNEEEFVMVTGETRQTLSEGFIIPAQVTAIRGKVANCILDSGLEGTIFIDNVSDEQQQQQQRAMNNIGDILQLGQTINCKVLRIDRERFMVDLSCKASDTRPGSDYPLRTLPMDPYYDQVQETKENEQHRASRRKQARSKRIIKHPLFRSFNHIEAEDYLAPRQRGDLVIRPSSQGYDHIAITWKVDEDVYQHVNITEVKNRNDPHAPARLKIGNQLFEDLDELIVTYVEAVSRKAEELMLHTKYVAGGIKKLNEHLTALTQANPKMSCYGFCQSEKPGYFDLGFKLNLGGPCMRWVVKVLPDGYRLHTKMPSSAAGHDVSYPQVDDLINGFKQLQHSEAQKHKQRNTKRY